MAPHHLHLGPCRYGTAEVAVSNDQGNMNLGWNTFGRKAGCSSMTEELRNFWTRQSLPWIVAYEISATLSLLCAFLRDVSLEEKAKRGGTYHR
jgi:hypothetical protein